MPIDGDSRFVPVGATPRVYIYARNKTAESLELNFTRLILYIRSPSRTPQILQNFYVLFRYQSPNANARGAEKSLPRLFRLTEGQAGGFWHVATHIPKTPAGCNTVAVSPSLPRERVCQVAIKSPKKHDIYDDDLTC